MRNVILAATLFVAACTVDVEKELPPGAQLSCASAEACPSDMTCDTAGGLCVGRGLAANGSACATWLDCASASCVGLVCCATDCADEGAASCGQTGLCETTAGPRFGQCAVYSASTQCRFASCAAGVFTTDQQCAGDGTACPAPPATCAGNVPCQDATSCGPPCTVGTSTGCGPSQWCRQVGATPTCSQYYQPNGGACSVDYQCVSNHCSGGICCDSGDCCNGSTANCPSGGTYCNSACGAYTVVPVCNPSTFSCTTREDPVTASYCDGQTCSNPNGWCGTNCLWVECAPYCSAGSCGTSCSETGLECFDC